MNQSNSIRTAYEVTLTQKGWVGIESIAEKFSLSVSELFEGIGHRLLAVVDPEDVEDYLDLQDALEAETAPESQVRNPWEQVKQELGL